MSYKDVKRGLPQRDTRVMAVINQKGGVGKSTTVINLSACLGESKKKVLVIDFPLQRHKLQMGVEVKTSDSDALERIKKEEMEITRRKVELLLSTGANVIVCGHTIDDLCLKYLVERGCIGIRRVSNDDMVRVSKAMGCSVVVVGVEWHAER